MTLPKFCLLLAFALGLAGCASEPASRSYGVERLTIASQGGPSAAAMAPAYAVTAVQVIVPPTLKVSEANTFKPRADIVWHGDPAGNRYQQVHDIVDAAARQAVAPMGQGRPVTLTLTMAKFHALTEKTRYTFGGTHELRFDLTVTDATTGAVIDGPRRIVADTRAAGGAQAIAEDAAGRTQKVVITERLVEVLRRELAAPVGPRTDPMLVSRAGRMPLLPVLFGR